MDATWKTESKKKKRERERRRTSKKIEKWKQKLFGKIEFQQQKKNEKKW